MIKRSGILMVAILAALVLLAVAGTAPVEAKRGDPLVSAANSALYRIEHYGVGRVNKAVTRYYINKALRLSDARDYDLAAASFSTARAYLNRGRWADAYSWILRGKRQAKARR